MGSEEEATESLEETAIGDEGEAGEVDVNEYELDVGSDSLEGLDRSFDGLDGVLGVSLVVLEGVFGISLMDLEGVLMDSLVDLGSFPPAIVLLLVILLVVEVVVVVVVVLLLLFFDGVDGTSPLLLFFGVSLMLFVASFPIDPFPGLFTSRFTDSLGVSFPPFFAEGFDDDFDDDFVDDFDDDFEDDFVDDFVDDFALAPFFALDSLASFPCIVVWINACSSSRCLASSRFSIVRRRRSSIRSRFSFSRSFCVNSRDNRSSSRRAARSF